MNLPSTRKEAKEIGSVYYFTATPCKHGHIDRQYTKDYTCVSCRNIRGSKWRNTNKNKEAANQLKYRKDNKEEIQKYQKIYHQQHYNENKEYILSRNRKWMESNLEYFNEYAVEYKIQHKDDIMLYHQKNYNKNKDKILSKNKEWKENNKNKCHSKLVRKRTSSKHIRDERSFKFIMEYGVSS